MTRLVLALKGDLEKAIKDDLRAGERAVTRAIKTATQGLKDELRGEVIGSGLGARLSKTWRSQTFPKGGASLGAAGLVFSKAPKLVRAFSETTRIKSKNGFFLAVPTPSAPKRGVGRKRISPENWPEHRFGKLRFVYRRTGPSLLVADNLRASFSRKTGQQRGFRKGSKRSLKTGQGLTTVIMFWLVPQVTLRKRLDPQRAFESWGRRLGAMIAQNWDQEAKQQ